MYLFIFVMKNNKHTTINIHKSGRSKTGFLKLLVHQYPLATFTGFYVPPQFCDVSLKNFCPNRFDLKKKGLHLDSATNFFDFCQKLT